MLLILGTLSRGPIIFPLIICTLDTPTTTTTPPPCNKPPVQTNAAALWSAYLWPGFVFLLTAACVATTLQSWPSIIYTHSQRAREDTHTHAQLARTHTACTTYSILCPGATPDFKLQLAEPEGKLNLEGSSAEVTQTGNNCLSHIFLQRARVSLCVCWRGCEWNLEGVHAHSLPLYMHKRRQSLQIFSRRCSWFRVFLRYSNAPLLRLFQPIRFPFYHSVCVCISSGLQARLHGLIKSEHVSPGQCFLITFSFCFILSTTLQGHCGSLCMPVCENMFVCVSVCVLPYHIIGPDIKVSYLQRVSQGFSGNLERTWYRCISQIISPLGYTGLKGKQSHGHQSYT